MYRQFPRPVKRLVIKFGSSVIATDLMKPREEQLRALVEQICNIRKSGVEVIVVSSGAIVLGMGEMGLSARTGGVATLQMLAAVGQTVLMNKYTQYFQEHKSTCAQVLLTWDDFDNRKRYNNARLTLLECAANHVVPVINENDTISTEEIKFGDNDKLSALVAGLVRADLLVLLSDVEGLYDTRRADKKVFREIKDITAEIEGVATGTANKHMSKGGMSAKLGAVKMATRARVPCIIASGETPRVLERILKGERIGTFFLESEEKVIARKHWISFGAKPKGEIVIDDGAQKALLKGGVSLLLPGVAGWSGHFKKDDVVVVRDSQGQEIARGLINYSVADLNKLTDRRGRTEAIHCDNLVFSER
jgi:glutamate 5-kinase